MQGLTWEGWGKVVLRAPSFHREEFEEAVWLGVADLALNPDPGCVTLSRSLDGDTFPVPRVLYRFDETFYMFSRRAAGLQCAGALSESKTVCLLSGRGKGDPGKW